MTLRHALMTWLLMIPLAFANGLIRQFVFVRHMSEAAARQLSCVTAVALFSVLIVVVSRRWHFRSAKHAIGVGLLWAICTALFEVGLGRLRSMAWSDIFRDYAIWEGRWWGLVLVSLIAMPSIVATFDSSRSKRRGPGTRVFASE
jgi:hypothetical protein